MNIALVKPTLEMKPQAEAFRSSFVNNGESVIYGSCGMLRRDQYEDWLDYIGKVSSALVPDRIPSDTYFAVDGDKGGIVGIIDIRHTLNDEYFNSGHIGYSVSPAERKKGYGSHMLRLGLEKAKALGLQRILISCHRGNAGSQKVIENNGGIFEKEVPDGEKKLLLYWIEVK